MMRPRQFARTVVQGPSLRKAPNVRAIRTKVMTDHIGQDCGLELALDIIAAKWKPAIIWQLHFAPTRFGALRRSLPGVSERVLAKQLRELEADGVVERAVYEEAVQRVEYSLTPSGRELNAAVHALAEWGLRHRALRPEPGP